MMNLPVPVLWIAQVSLRGSLVVALLICARPFLRRWVGSRATAGLWLVPAACLLVPCAPGWRWHLPAAWPLSPEASFRSAPPPSAVRVAIGPVAGGNPAAPSALPARSKRLPFSRPEGGLSPDANVWNVLWLGGVGLAVANLGVGWLRGRRWAARTAPVESGSRLARAFAAIPASCRRGVSLRLTTALEAPAAAGVWRPQIWLPRGWAEELEEVELRHVLLHELGHVRRHDLLAQWVCALACCLHWFNPLAWLLAARARAERELACDAWVLARGSAEEGEDFPAAYGRTLIRIVARLRVPAAWPPPLPVVPMAAGKGNLSLRVREISTFRPLPPWRGIVAWLFATVVAAALVTGRAAEPPPGAPGPGGGPTPAPSPAVSPAAESQTFNAEPEEVPPERLGSIPADRLRLSYETNNIALSAAAVRQLQKEAARYPAQADLIDSLAASFAEKPAETAAQPAGFSVSRIIPTRESQELIRRLGQCEGVDFLTAPRVTSKPDQKATVEIITEFPYVTKFARVNDPAGHPMLTATGFGKKNLGLTLTVDGSLSPSRNAVDLNVSWQMVDLQSFVRTSDGKPIANSDYKNEDERPVFSTQVIDTCVTMPTGTTLVLGGARRQPGSWRGLSADEKIKESSIVLTLIHVRLVALSRWTADAPGAAGGSPVPEPAPTGSPSAEPGLDKDGKTYPYGVSVPGKPGFVTSPYAPAAGYVDVQGFARGADVRDPYTGKRFLVP